MIHERWLYGDFKKLRSPERIAILEIEHVVEICKQAFTPRSILDEGTGTGLFAGSFLSQGMQVYGVDRVPGMLLEAAKQVPGALFQAAELENLPFANHSVDLAFMGLVLHEAANPEKALQEAARVARKGIAVLEWPYIEQAHGPPLGTRISAERMMALTRDAGLQIIQRTRLKELELTLLTHISDEENNEVYKD